MRNGMVVATLMKRQPVPWWMRLKKTKRRSAMLKKMKGTLTTVAAIALLVGLPGFTHAQSAENPQKGHQHMEGQMLGEGMGQGGETPACCQGMMAKKKEMRAMQEEAQAELDLLVARINSTTGETQQVAIAELLTKLVAQRSQMGGMMEMEMHSEMMQKMMSGGMSDCPMMQKMQGGKQSAEEQSDAEDDHSQHH
jgi:hypothetical protein